MSVFLTNLDDFIAPSQACVVVNYAESKKDKDAVTSVSKRIVLSTTDTDEQDLSSRIGIGKKEGIIKPSISKSNTESKIASVSLNDCLACSGCVTSAETVLIQQQSLDRFKELIQSKSNRPLIVLSLSPNSRASIAQFLSISQTELFLRTASLLKSLGVEYVVDAGSTVDVALMESREDFLQRYRMKSTNSTTSTTTSSRWIRPQTTTAVSSTAVKVFDEKTDFNSGSQPPTIIDVAPSEEAASLLPLLTSNCPGWICFAEKTHPQAIPFISTVKSPQQILGLLIKSMLSQRPSGGLSLGDLDSPAPQSEVVVVVSVQPCYDKKLEASRLDFLHSATDCKEVDLVLSTSEFWQLLVQQSTTTDNTAARVHGRGSLEVEVDLDTLHGSAEVAAGEEASAAVVAESVREFLLALPPDPPQGRDDLEALFRCFSDGEDRDSSNKNNNSSSSSSRVGIYSSTPAQSGSGGYAEHIFRYAADRLFGLSLPSTRPLPYVLGRNPDMAELDIQTLLPPLSSSSSSVNQGRSLKFGRAYGFRNIQSVILKLKRDKCDLDFIEVMACPSGCNNGGGQIKIVSSDNRSSASSSDVKQRIAAVEATFHEDLKERRPEDNPLVRLLYGEQRLGRPMSERARRLLHTRYHAVPKLELLAPLAVKW